METILAIDVGNTRIKWGLWRDRGFIAQGAVPSGRAPELADAWHALARPQRAVGSSVGPESVRSMVDAVLAPWGVVPEWIVSQRSQCGVVSRYADPPQLGSDRWAALIGARARTKEPCIVVNVGTAATIDALSDAGEFLGGLIIPAPDLMAEALAQRTARLAREAGHYELFPSGTGNAIFTGAVEALCGAIERMKQHLEQTVGGSSSAPRLFMSGGGAAMLVPYLRQMPDYVPALVLEGLAAIARA